MATLVRIGKSRIINLDNVTEIVRNGTDVSIYFAVPGNNGVPDYVKLHDDEARRVLELFVSLCQFEV